MNTYAQIILAALLAGYFLKILADLLNLRALRREAPGRLRDIYEAGAYARSQEYTRVETRFGFVTSTFDLAVLLAFWFSGGFSWLDTSVRGFGLGSLGTGLLFFGALGLAKEILSLPFNVYWTFVIEGKFGFNRTTPRVFLVDTLKGLVISTVLTGAVLSVVLILFEHAGPAAWIYCWIASTIFVLGLQIIYPAWILPIFNKFEPLPEGELREAISRYAGSVHFTLSDISVMDGSRRSTRSNAFFAGIGKKRRIALFDTLIDNHTVPELVSVLAHEIGHYKKKHVVKHMVLSIGHIGIMFFLLSKFLSNEGLFEAFYMEQVSVYGALVFFSLLYVPVELLLQIFLHQQMRRDEFEADRFAAETAGTEPMTSALKKIAADNLTNLTPHPFYVLLNHSHPPLLRRLEAIQEVSGATP